MNTSLPLAAHCPDALRLWMLTHSFTQQTSIKTSPFSQLELYHKHILQESTVVNFPQNSMFTVTKLIYIMTKHCLILLRRILSLIRVLSLFSHIVQACPNTNLTYRFIIFVSFKAHESEIKIFPICCCVLRGTE